MKPAPATTPLVERKYLIPFVLITSLFALWGFANDITNPMVAAFQTVMEISAAKASLIQFAFYGGYFTMAIPAALFIRRYSYKSAQIYIAARNMGFEPDGMTDAQMKEISAVFGLPK